MKLSRTAIALALIVAAAYWGRWEVGTVVQDAINPVDGSDVDTLARTIWGEARGEGQTGMQAVANVVMNRHRSPGWWSRNVDDIPDDTVAAVCRDPWQFSCWNPTDPNSVKLRTVNLTDANFRAAVNIATRAVGGMLPDITGGATHYHAAGINPSWVSGAILTKVIGRHRFYRGVR